MSPRNHIETVARLARESDEVLGAFIRGQIAVMIALGLVCGLVIYLLLVLFNPEDYS